MAKVPVDSLVFDFPAGWRVSKYDDWSFYRNQFSRLRKGVKAVDLLVVDNSKVAWLIEAKDYRTHTRTKTTCISEEFRDKILDSLAGITSAKFNATDREEIDVARRCLKAKKLRVVLHIEQRVTGSKLFPRAIKLADIKQKLRAMLKCVDAHPLVVESSRMGSLLWTVR